ncbi:replication endonuclease [Shewanella sp. NKUCC06_TVS]|uniref:replication endonuclease n=1 Tax=Shewanella sp. NKUCC06_TVS TaxID=2842128 RepID=UPI001C5B3D30|nr:replication endonuclease [Shewanella sp. NKUCC06_TVS]MBW3531026.1 replication endonuclease [Shewanella sp. NKUCC06_TVS]
MLNVHEHDKQWLENKLYGLPSPHRIAIMRQYRKKPNRREANLSLLHLTKRIAAVMGKDKHFYHVNIEQQDLMQRAKQHARRCIQITAQAEGKRLLTIYNTLLHYMACYSIKPPKLSETIINHLKLDTLDEIELAQVYGALARAGDEIWWKRKLRKQRNLQIETISRELNLVSKQKGIYASNITVSNFQTQWQNNQQLLENTIATNEHGYSASLAELSKLNVSNPAIRKAELMVRIRGFEDYAKEMDYSALFLTMTTPSKYHRCFARTGDENPNWNGATPLVAQEYLNRTFARIRATLAREQVTPFGFRVAEPHHDGTPHWHLLLFIPTEQQQTLVDTFTHYCLEEDGDEQGAKERRFKVEYIDPAKGSATGYIMKYIYKNIDGEGIEYDSYGKDASSSAIRIKVWASCWGIRQFQQVGGVGVTPWRELRRLDAIKDPSFDWIEAIRQAADNSNWALYTQLMGGVFCKRVEQTIRPLYQTKTNALQARTTSNRATNTQSKPIVALIQQQSRNALQEYGNSQKECGNYPENSDNLLRESANRMRKSSPAMQETISGTVAVFSGLDAGLTSELASGIAGINSESTPENYQPLKTNRYGDSALTQLKGIVSFGVEIITRVHTWTLATKSQVQRNAFCSHLEFCQ